MAVMRVAQAAGVRRRGSSGQRDGNEGPGKREQQQEYGCAALHFFFLVKQNPDCDQHR